MQDSEQKFNKGDKVRIKHDFQKCNNPNHLTGFLSEGRTHLRGKVATVSHVYIDGDLCIESVESIYSDDCFDFIVPQDAVEPINSNSINNNNNNNNYMSKVVNFVKNSFLSKNEKLLREQGLKDECGGYTSDAREIVMLKIMQENEDYLVETSKSMQKEEN